MNQFRILVAVGLMVFLTVNVGLFSVTCGQLNVRTAETTKAMAEIEAAGGGLTGMKDVARILEQDAVDTRVARRATDRRRQRATKGLGRDKPRERTRPRRTRLDRADLLTDPNDPDIPADGSGQAAQQVTGAYYPPEAEEESEGMGWVLPVVAAGFGGGALLLVAFAGMQLIGSSREETVSADETPDDPEVEPPV